jgi:hypothetical protein
MVVLHVNKLLRHDQSIVTNEGAAGGPYALLAIGGEWDVGGSCMASVERPFGLAVADDEATRSRHAVFRYGREPGEKKKNKEDLRSRRARDVQLGSYMCKIH